MMIKKIDIISKKEKETFNLGIDISKDISNGDVIGLIGNLASGKTTFVKGLLKGLGYRYEVTSPTFTLINEYDAKYKVIHIDFYREENIQRWHNIGFDYLFDNDAVILIEWADLFPELLPENTYRLFFDHYHQKYRKIYSK